ncbi:MAG: hypothetical protein HOQ05_12390 [Corynebacteriales bacterium]|nr:hypothetical protein [Mycobacteriales bacterium]
MNEQKLPPHIAESLAAFNTDVPEPSDKFLLRTRNKLTTAPVRRTSTLSRVVRWGAVTVTVGVVGAIAISLLPADPKNPIGARPASAAAILREAAENAHEVEPGTGSYVHIQYQDKTLIGVPINEDGTPLSNDRQSEYQQAKKLYYYDNVVGEQWISVNGIDDMTGQETLRHSPELFEGTLADLEKAGISPGPPVFTMVPIPNQGPARGMSIRQDDSEIPAGDPNHPSRLSPFMNPTSDKLASLPTEPAALGARIEDDLRQRNQPVTKINMLATVSRLFGVGGDALMSPELREALFLVVADIPGIERFDQVDLAGRKGIALGVEEDGLRQEIIIDPDKSKVLGQRLIVVGDNQTFPNGTVAHSSSFTANITTSQPNVD